MITSMIQIDFSNIFTVQIKYCEHKKFQIKAWYQNL